MSATKEEEEAVPAPVEPTPLTKEMFYDELIGTLKDVIHVLELRKEGKTPFPGGKGDKKKRVPSDRPLSGYQKFMKENMAAVKEEVRTQQNSEKGGKEVFKILAEMWNSSEEKKTIEAEKAAEKAAKKDNASSGAKVEVKEETKKEEKKEEKKEKKEEEKEEKKEAPAATPKSKGKASKKEEKEEKEEEEKEETEAKKTKKRERKKPAEEEKKEEKDEDKKDESETSEKRKKKKKKHHDED